MEYTVKYVDGHVEVYDEKNQFVFSADNKGEAYEELRKIA